MTPSGATFSGKTMFISGASRGIGLAIAKRVAADGANVALVAKTTEPHPKLPGTIYTAAKEIEEPSLDLSDLQKHAEAEPPAEANTWFVSLSDERGAMATTALQIKP